MYSSVHRWVKSTPTVGLKPHTRYLQITFTGAYRSHPPDGADHRTGWVHFLPQDGSRPHPSGGEDATPTFVPGPTRKVSPGPTPGGHRLHTPCGLGSTSPGGTRAHLSGDPSPTYRWVQDPTHGWYRPHTTEVTSPTPLSGEQATETQWLQAPSPVVPCPVLVSPIPTPCGSKPNPQEGSRIHLPESCRSVPRSIQAPNRGGYSPHLPMWTGPNRHGCRPQTRWVQAPTAGVYRP